MTPLTKPLLFDLRAPADNTRSVLVVGDPVEWTYPALASLAQDRRLRVLGVVERAADALTLVSTLQPDVVLVDCDPPDMSGEALVRRLRTMARGGRTVLVGPCEGLRPRLHARATGADGYVPKRTLCAERILAMLH